MSAEIWTICLFSSQRGSRPERPASGLHSLRWNAVAAWLPNQTPCESSVPAASHVWLLGCFFLWLPNAVYTCLFMLPQDALFTTMEHITAELGGGGGGGNRKPCVAAVECGEWEKPPSSMSRRKEGGGGGGGGGGGEEEEARAHWQQHYK